jgi:hypothetical protein
MKRQSARDLALCRRHAFARRSRSARRAAKPAARRAILMSNSLRELFSAILSLLPRVCGDFAWFRVWCSPDPRPRVYATKRFDLTNGRDLVLALSFYACGSSDSWRFYPLWASIPVHSPRCGGFGFCAGIRVQRHFVALLAGILLLISANFTSVIKSWCGEFEGTVETHRTARVNCEPTTIASSSFPTPTFSRRHHLQHGLDAQFAFFRGDIPPMPTSRVAQNLIWKRFKTQRRVAHRSDALVEIVASGHDFARPFSTHSTRPISS